jgi:hypothetical protein
MLVSFSRSTTVTGRAQEEVEGSEEKAEEQLNRNIQDNIKL